MTVKEANVFKWRINEIEQYICIPFFYNNVNHNILQTVINNKLKPVFHNNTKIYMKCKLNSVIRDLTVSD